MEAVIIVLLLLAALIFVYFIPAMVASSRDHPSKGGIIVLNTFLGWTFIGWVVSLAWALSDTRRHEPDSPQNPPDHRAETQSAGASVSVERLPSEPGRRSDGYQTTYWDERGRLRCAECDKIAYPNESRAMQVASQAEKRGEYFRAYREERCGHWHLTSQLVRLEDSGIRVGEPATVPGDEAGCVPPEVRSRSVVWSATLTVGGDAATALGFNSDPRSGYGSIPDARFELDGTDCEVTQFALASGRLAFAMNVELPEDTAAGLALRVSGRSFAFRDAQYISVPLLAFYTHRWPDSGLEWNGGDRISVELRR